MTDNTRRRPPRTVDSREVHAGVDRVLLSHGEYIPVELLIDQGRLEYAEYEAWRCGARNTLAEVLLGSRRRITSILLSAANWARLLGLEPAAGHYRSWGMDGVRELRLAAEPKLAALLETHYQRPADRGQLDLFMDGTESAVRHDLVNALANRDRSRARAALAILSENFPEHPAIVDAERLVDALAYLDTDQRATQIDQELRGLRDHLRPAAERLLAARERDFMAPFWRRLAERLTGAQFDSARPRRHASWVWAQCLEWRRVRASVLESPGFEGEPILLIRLAVAELALGQRAQAIMRIGLLCWRFAAQVDAALQDKFFTDTGVRLAWEAFQDLDLEPPVDAAWFPVMLLLAEPGLANAWDQSPPDEDAPASRAFRALQSLLTMPVDAGQQAVLTQRRALRDSHPGFLSLYLARRRE